MRQIEHDERHNDDDLDLDSMISDRMDEIKTNIGTFVKFEIKHMAKDDDEKSVDDIRKKAINELMGELKSLKKKFG